MRATFWNIIAMKTCKSCELIANRNAGTAPLWDCIYRTPLWDVAHCYETALPGWLVLIARRHIESLDELTDPEAVELGRLIHSTSSALKEITGCVKTYVLQFAESPQHPHVHFHIIPRMADQPEDRRSTQIFGYLGVPEDERVSQEVMNAIALKVREKLQAVV
jgi:diadenosine tetraphosphate (Ap4A) HIT family hydrolase